MQSGGSLSNATLPALQFPSHNATFTGIAQFVVNCSSISPTEDQDVAKIIEKINKRPRKCLGFKTPSQLFIGPNQHVALAS
jgi:IS30 family transposase